MRIAFDSRSNTSLGHLLCIPGTNRVFYDLEVVSHRDSDYVYE